MILTNEQIRAPKTAAEIIANQLEYALSLATPGPRHFDDNLGLTVSSDRYRDLTVKHDSGRNGDNDMRFIALCSPENIKVLLDERRALLSARQKPLVDGIFKPGDAVGVFNIGNEFCPDHLVAWTVKGQNLPAGNYWLYIHQAPSMPDQSALADAIDAIVNDVLSVETIATTGAIKALFSMKTGEMRLAAAVAPSIPAAGGER
ncbi:hypothetical protein [Phytobacter sp. V91]|uniref:hypothetical protein n=1 Tax=Phytobacter sp. V91 TaxID=3369425 RepID=UPI003F5F561C